MTYLELYENALRKLNNSLITLGEFLKIIEPLNREVESKVGEWLIRTDNDPICRPWYNTCKCSKCGQYGTKVWNYCPYCGADMKGEEE